MKKLALFTLLSLNFAIAEEKVILSVYQTPTSLMESTSAVDVISEDQIKETKPLSIVELLNTISSISFTSNGGFGQTTGVYLRGFKQIYTLVMIDGVRINDPVNLNGVSLEHLLPTDIERIEIVKGSQSGVWGADAIAGVINIITKKPKKGFSADSYFEYGSFVTKRYGTTLSYADDKFYIQLGLHKFDSQSISAAEPAKGSPVYGKRWNQLGMEPDPYRNDTVNLKIGLNITPEDKVEANMKFVDAVTHYDGYDSVTFKPADAENVSHVNQKFYNFSYEKSFYNNRLNLYYNQSDFERVYIEPKGWIPYNFYNGQFKEFGMKDRWDYKNGSFLQVGVLRQDFISKENPHKRYHNTGWFITNLNTFGRFILSESFRFDNYSAFQDKITYKVGGKVFITDKVNLFANYGTGYKVPIPYQLFDPMYGNSNLKPEKSRNFDIGFSYDTLSLTYFNYRIENIIDFDMNTWKYSNITGTSKIDGFEAQIKKDIKPLNLVISGGYTYTWASKYDGTKLPRIPQDKININLVYYPAENLTVVLNGEYIGKRKDSQLNPVQTGYYSVVNGTVNFQPYKHLTAYMKIYNLTDKFYQTTDGYASVGMSVYLGVNLSY
ncbi:MAG: TonB-dependent receptor [Hydrogenothermaceae bacterium]